VRGDVKRILETVKDQWFPMMVGRRFRKGRCTAEGREAFVH
jgi:hypothetical protein